MIDYLSLAGRCQTVNEFNRLHIDLENVLSPMEIAGIAAYDLGLPQRSRAWLAKIKGLHAPVLEQPRAFRRRAISDYLNFYFDPDGPTFAKTLLLGFSGNARRLMLPASVFLQFFDPSVWDVLILRRSEHRSYLHGLDGVATDLPGLVDHLRDAIPLHQYRRIVTFGTSAGGYAASWAAILLDAGRGICVGGSMKIASNKLGTPSVYGGPRRDPPLLFVYGGDFERDCKAALALQDCFGGVLRPVAGVDRHGVLPALLARGELGNFFAEVLSD